MGGGGGGGSLRLAKSLAYLVLQLLFSLPGIAGGPGTRTEGSAAVGTWGGGGGGGVPEVGQKFSLSGLTITVQPTVLLRGSGGLPKHVWSYIFFFFKKTASGRTLVFQRRQGNIQNTGLNIDNYNNSKNNSIII